MSLSRTQNSGLRRGADKEKSIKNLSNAAVITSATPAVSSISFNGKSYDVYRFTSSGTLTVGSPGYARVLIVGGGGGAGLPGYFPGAGSGGAGGFQEEDLYLIAGTYTISVAGAGGESVFRFPANPTRSPIIVCRAGGGGGNSTPHGGTTGGSGASGGGAGYAGVPGTAFYDQAQGTNASGGTGGGAGGAGTGLSSSITGTSVLYAKGAGPAVANSGNGAGGAGSGVGASGGVVIVRVEV